MTGPFGSASQKVALQRANDALFGSIILLIIFVAAIVIVPLLMVYLT